KAPRAGRHDGRFAIATGIGGAPQQALRPQEQALLQRLGSAPVPLEDLLQVGSQQAVLDGLVARGLVHLSAITPSDALHVLGGQSQWSAQAARLGFELSARRRDGAGQPVAETAEVLAAKVVARLTRQSADAILATCLEEEGGG